MARRASGNSALKKAITELEGMVLQRRQQLDSLSAERRRLSTRDSMVRILERQARALLELGAMLKQAHGGSGRASPEAGAAEGGSGSRELRRWLSLSGEAADVVRGLGAAASSEEGMSTDGEPGEFEVGGGAGGDDSSGSAAMGAQSTGSRGSDTHSLGAPGAAAAANPDGVPGSAAAAEALSLGWSISAAAQRAAGPLCDASTEGLRRQLRSFVLMSAPLLIRLQRAAPDAEAARARIKASRTELMEHCALIAFADGDGAGGPSPFGAVLLSPLDAAAAAATAPQLGGGEPPVPAADDVHWQWAVAQMQLDEAQEEQLLALLNIVGTRIARVAAERTGLIDQCAACPGDAAEQERLVARISAVQRGYQIVSAAAVLAVYGSLLSSDQVARFMVACYPWVCPLGGLLQTLAAMRARRGAAPSATAGVAETSPAGAGAKQTGAVPHGRRSSSGGHGAAAAGCGGGGVSLPGQQAAAGEARSDDTCSSSGVPAPAAWQQG